MSRVHGRHAEHQVQGALTSTQAVATAQPVAKRRRVAPSPASVPRGPLVIPKRHLYGPLLCFAVLALALHAWAAFLPVVALLVVVWRFRRDQ